MSATNKFLLGFNVLATLVAMVLLGAVYRAQRNWSALAMGPKPGAPMPFDVVDSPGAMPVLDGRRAKHDQLQAQYVARKKRIAERQVVGVKDEKVVGPDNKETTRTIPGLREIAAIETRLALAQEESERITNVRLSPQVVQNVTDLTADNQTVSQEHAARAALVEELRAGIMETRRERDAIFAALASAQADINAKINELAPVRSGYDLAVQTYQKARTVAARFAVSIRPKPAAGEVARQGRVMASSASGKIVISLGADDGVLPGEQMMVYRHGAKESYYLGKIRILSAEPEKSIGLVLPEFKRGAIERDDHVKRLD